MHRTLNDPWGISHSLSSLALVSLEEHADEAVQRLVAESVALELKAGDWPGLVFNLEICAGLAAREDRHERAVRLYACANALRGPVGTHPSEVHWPDPETAVAQLRTTLDEHAFAHAWTQGRAMELDEALAYALEEDAP